MKRPPLLHTNPRIYLAFSMALAFSTAALTVACGDDEEKGSGGAGSTSSSTTGNGHQGGGGAAAVPSFSTDVLPIITRSCAKSSCHGNAAAPSAQLDLRAEQAYGEMVGPASLFCLDQRKLIAPGNPAGSQILNRIKGIDLCGGERMPLPPNPALSDAETATISDWIEAGALFD